MTYQAMSYQHLMMSAITREAIEAAKDLCILHGYETEASQDDIEYIDEIEKREMGGC